MRIWPFKSADRKALTDEQLLELLGGGVSTSAGVAVSAETALRVPAVAAAVRTISEAAASLDLRVMAVADDGTETPDRSHPAWPLLADDANDWTSGFELVRTLIVDALTRDAGGLAFVNWVNGAPREIIRYRPGVIQADLTRDTGEPVYRIQGRQVPAQSIVHVRGPFERSPLTLAREAIGVALVMEQHAARLFGTGARPGGIIRTRKNVGDEGVKRMLAGWRAAHEGAGNSGKTAVLWDDAEWQQMQLSSVDAQFQQLRLFQLQEIARAFNIPAPMLGDLSRATWSNSTEMGRQFLVLCLEPWLQALEGALRRALFLPEDRRRFAVRVDRDDLTRASLTERATAINSLRASKVLSANEGRSWIDLPPYAGGDVYENTNITAGPSADLRNEDPDPEDDPDAA